MVCQYIPGIIYRAMQCEKVVRNHKIKSVVNSSLKPDGGFQVGSTPT